MIARPLAANVDQTAIPEQLEVEQTGVQEFYVLSDRTRAIVKATTAVLAEKGVELTTCMYRRMFSENPELRAYFNHSHQATGKQGRSLAGAIHAVAANIDRLHVLGAAIERIAHKHASLNVRPEHYPIVGKHLIKAIQEVLGDAATPDIIEAWAETYMFLANIFIQAEQKIYLENAQARGGWSEFRRFRVVGKVPECETITSFYLQPVDRKPLARFKPGQYLTLKFPNMGTHGVMRNYSLSDRPGHPYYRVTIKREDLAAEANPQESVSHHMHDTVELGDEIEVGPPCGDFVLQAHGDRPIVLLSAGVGLTPLVSMLHHLAETGHKGPVYFIHGTHNRQTHALNQEVRDIARNRDNFHVHVCYSKPSVGCVKGEDYHTEGRVTGSMLKEVLPGPDCEFYFLGPIAFMHAMRHALRDWGVVRDRLHFGFFGPSEDLD